MQETWGRFKNGILFQRTSVETPSWRIRNHDRNYLENNYGLEASAPENTDFGAMNRKPFGPELNSESVEHAGTKFANRSKLFALPQGTRHGQEGSESDKRNHVHFVLKELKVKMRKSERFTDSRTSPRLLDFGGTPHTEPVICDAERPGNQRRADDGANGDTKSPSPALSSSKHEDHGGNTGNWFSKVAKIPRNVSSEVIPARRFRPISMGKSRGGLLGLGRGAQNTQKFGNFFQNIGRDHDAAPDRGTFKRNRGQAGKRGFQVLRRVKSFDSSLNADQSGLPFVFRNGPNKAKRHSELLAEVDFLEKSLWDCEFMLAILVDRQGKIRDKFSLEIESLKQRCASLDRTQEIHYRSVLDVFNENYRILGYVESHFAYLMSLIPKARPGTASDFVIDILRFMGDNTVSTILKIVRGATSLYSYFFPRNRNIVV